MYMAIFSHYAPRLLLSALLLAACGNTTGADVVRVMVWPIPLPDSWAGGPPAERAGDWDAAAATPGEGEPALSLTLGSRRGVATLIQQEGERRLWRTSGGIVVATEGARVVATAGLRDILAATRFDGADPLLRIAEVGDGTLRGARVVDMMRAGRDPAQMRFGLRLECRLRQSLESEAGEDDLVLIEEACTGAASFTNRFWADPQSYAVYRSEQWVGEGMPPLVVEVVSAAPASLIEVVTLPR